MRLTWNLSTYRNNLSDDIEFAQSTVLGEGLFQNVGATRRQWFDAGLNVTTPGWCAWISYSYVNATFQSSFFVEASVNSPAANANGNIFIQPGNRLPGIPADMIRFGAEYTTTPQWKAGGATVATTSQYRAEPEHQLPDHASVQVYGLMQNAFDATYYTYRTFSPTSSTPINAGARREQSAQL